MKFSEFNTKTLRVAIGLIIVGAPLAIIGMLTENNTIGLIGIGILLFDLGISIVMMILTSGRIDEIKKDGIIE